MQTPPTHTCVPAQIAPPVQSADAPQRFRSVEVSTQRPPQAMSPPRQVVAAEPHAPALQTSPAPHVAPPVQSAAAPQCAGSFLASTQLPAQTANPAGHESAQVPAAHTAPAAQSTPSLHVVAPQRLRSIEGSTHRPPHASWPAGHSTRHVPPVQTCPESHHLPPVQSDAIPHAQEVVCGSMHQFQHMTCPAPQPTALATHVPALQT